MKKSSQLPIRIINIEDDGFHLMVSIKIGRKKANMLLDTGASRTVFDQQRIARFLPENQEGFEKNERLSTGLGTNTLESQVTELKSMKLGDIKISGFQAIILDMKHVNESYKQLGLPPIDGVVGSDLLMKYDAVIDYKEGLLKLES
jgi:predicted aspartyl protease